MLWKNRTLKLYNVPKSTTVKGSEFQAFITHSLKKGCSGQSAGKIWAMQIKRCNPLLTHATTAQSTPPLPGASTTDANNDLPQNNFNTHFTSFLSRRSIIDFFFRCRMNRQKFSSWKHVVKAQYKKEPKQSYRPAYPHWQ